MATDTTPVKLRIPGNRIDGAALTIPNELKDVFSIHSVHSFR